jgi:hypothetical protein
MFSFFEPDPAGTVWEAVTDANVRRPVVSLRDVKVARRNERERNVTFMAEVDVGMDDKVGESNVWLRGGTRRERESSR